MSLNTKTPLSSLTEHSWRLTHFITKRIVSRITNFEKTVEIKHYLKLIPSDCSDGLLKTKKMFMFQRP